jgi:drug/metabolite transporter (DMT)-like permease
MRVLLLSSAALVGFAANSLLTRAALNGGHLDAAAFALVRVTSGAVALALLSRSRTDAGPRGRPSWIAALALTGYLAAFTVAYTRIGAADGALLLFGAVQVTMIAAGLVRGERPARIDWLGAILAVAGLVVLTAPGLTAPDLGGAALMVLAGVAWGVYSLVGRGSRAPLGDTSQNFVRSAALLAIPLGGLAWPPHGTPTGLALAIISGAIASGLGYTLWYAALPSLSAWRAAVLQLVVPILTAAGAALLLAETVTVRLVISAGLVGTGVWLTSSPRWHRN